MGTKNTSTTTQTAPDQQALGAYRDILTQAGNVAQTPYQAYTGQLVAPVNQQQNLGIGGINQYANAAQPAYQTALTQAQSASQPLTAGQIQNYLNPYTQNVVNATQAQFNNQNAQQQQQVLGNAIAQGALGGNRSAIAQAELANQQQLAQAPVIANLYNQGYNQAVNTAQGQQAIGLQGAGLTGNLGAGAQQAGLAGAGAQIGAGTLQQQTQQALDQALYGQYAQQQAYPYQQLQWLAGIDTGVGSQMGGTSATTAPPPNPWATAAGLGTSGVGLLGATGAFGSSGWLASALPALAFAAKGGRINAPSYATGGVVPGYAAGGAPAGMPWADAPTWIPNMPITHGRGAPSPPAAFDPNKDIQKSVGMVGDIAKQLQGSPGSSISGPAYGGGSLLGGDAYGGSSSAPLEGLTTADYGPGFKKGGIVGYDDGGTVDPITGPNFNDRWTDEVKQLKDATPPVVNPDEPYRMPDKEAVQDWRHDSDHPNPALQADSGVAVPDDSSATPMAYTSRPRPDPNLPPEINAGASQPDQGISSAASPSQSGINWGADSKLWPSLISAGFGMMASRSPYLGQAIGEGGQAGVASYNAQQQQELEARRVAAELEHQAAEEKRMADAQKITAMNAMVIPGPDGKPMVNPQAIAAKQQIERDWQPKFQKVGVNMRGDDVMGVWDPNTRKAFDVNGNPLVIRNGIVQDSPGPGGTPPAGTPPSTSPARSPGVTPTSAPVNAAAPAPGSFNDRFGAAFPSSPANATAGAGVRVASLDTNFTPPPAPDPQAPPAQQAVQAIQQQAGVQTPAPPPHTADPTAAPGTDASRNTQFLAGIAAQDPGYALEIQKAADYQLDPAKVISMRTNHREHFIRDVLQYDPKWNPQDVGLIYRARTAFLPGTKNGDTIGSFNTAISHLDVLGELYKALKNGDVRLLTKVRNDWNTYFRGEPLPNTINAIGQLVSGEVVKASVGAQNALGDREELRKAVERDLSQRQATDVIDHFERLMGGKLDSIKFAYENSTRMKDFDEKYLMPRSREVLQSIQGKGGSGAHPTPTQSDYNYVREHPEKREMFIKRFGIEP